MKKNIVSILFFLFWICHVSLGQNPFIRHYSTLNGLPSNTVYQIYQDSQKYIWFTTDAGVVKFDGYNFINYRKKDGLSSNDVIRVKEDSKGRIWFFNYNASVNYFFDNKIYNETNAPFLKKMMGKGFIVDFYEGAKGELYFYNWQQEVYLLDSEEKISVCQLFDKSKFTFLKPSIRESIKVFQIELNSAKELSIWTSNGIFIQRNLYEETEEIDSSLVLLGVYPSLNNTVFVNTFNNIVIKFDKFFNRETIPFPGNAKKITAIIQDFDGYLWFSAFDEGVYCMKDGVLIKHLDIKDAQWLFEDNEHNIWVSSQSEGVFLINHDIINQKQIEKSSFQNEGLDLLCSSYNGGVWCSNAKTAFLYKKNELFTLDFKKSGGSIFLLFQYSNKSATLLLGARDFKLCTFDGLRIDRRAKAVYFNKKTFYYVLVKKIIINNDGSEAIMFDQNRIIKTYPKKPFAELTTNFVSERINNAFYNAKNEFIINGRANYIFKNKEIEPYPELSRFNGMLITDHLIMANSVELFNIDGDSLYLLKDKKIYNLTEAFNIPITLQIKNLCYKAPTLYMATLKNIFKCDDPLEVIANHQVHIQGLNIGFNKINDLLIENDSLYVASDEGLTIIPQKSIGKSVAAPPIPYYQAVAVNDKSIDLPLKELRLTGNNRIHLSFGCISFSASSIIYSYKLEGFEKDWMTGTGNGINIVYHDLSKGTYIFKLRVRKSNSDWSQPIELGITILPMFYERPLFWVGVGIILTALIILQIIRMKQRRRKFIEIKHQLIVMEQRALQSMINPHFIFNSLSSIQNYLLRNKAKDAVFFLTKFARLIRQNLNSVNTTMISIDEELERLRSYLELEKQRMENRFEFKIVVDKNIEEEIFIPTMIIQPFVENSIWHGITTQPSHGIILVNLLLISDQSLKVIIEDNGIGVKNSGSRVQTAASHLSLGMKLTLKRVELLGLKYHIKTSVKYSERYPGSHFPGTIVELIMPFSFTENS